MQSNIQSNNRLLIVSDTAIRKSNNTIEVFEPVAREIENFHYLFSEIIWIGYDYSEDIIKKNMRAIDNKVKIKYILLPRTGGRTYLKKALIFTKVIPYFLLILKETQKSQVIHTRAPSLPAFLSIIISMFIRKKIFWHKYAGSWIEKKVPPFYALQRFILKKAKNTIVTINGKWENQQKHILTFENPCLTKTEYQNAINSKSKDFTKKFNFCFIGNLNKSKGVDRIIEAFSSLDNLKIGKIHFIGDSPLRENYEKKSKNIDAKFYGFLLREEIEKLLEEMHFLLLPSSSEGFPKVLTEASSFGVIPVVTAISSIPQYINSSNGFLIEEVSTQSLIDTLEKILNKDTKELQTISNNTKKLSSIFTYEYYTNRIKNEIIGK